MISREQRHRRANPCPVCSGYDEMKRGRGERCFGFTSDDGKYVHCSREELAGGIIEEPGGTWAHYMAGPCRCGADHGGGLRAVSDKPEIVSSYDYTDADRKALFQVVRLAPKSFRARRPDGNGGWIWNTEGVELVPYRLPDALAAVKAGNPVFIVEGEKDADRLADFGLPATCNPFGAGKWRREFSKHLKGATVAIIPDNDAKGAAHADQIAASLVGVAAEVRIVALPDLPTGGDLSDWLAAGGTPEKLAEIIRCTEPLKSAEVVPEGVAIRLATEVKPRNVLYFSKAPPIALETVTVLAGLPGDGKSTIAIDLAARASRGTLEGDLLGKSAFTLYCTAEDSPEHTLVPRLLAAKADLSRIGFVSVHREGLAGNISLPDDVADLSAHVTARKAALVVVDPITAHLPAEINSHRDQDVRRAIAPLHKMAEATGAAVVVIMHLNKGSGDVFQRVGGSIAFTAAARNVLLTAADPSDPEGPGRVLTHAKSNLGPLAATERYHIAPEAVPNDDGEAISTSRIVWDGTAEGVTAATVLERTTAEERGALADAKEFLAAEIPHGKAVESLKVLERWKKQGGGERTLKTAKAQLGIPAFREGGFGPEGVWFWGWETDENRAPDGDGAKGAKDANGPSIQKPLHPLGDFASLGENVPRNAGNGFASLDEKAPKTPKDASPGDIGEPCILSRREQFEQLKAEAKKARP